jgi:hypothetical protein
VAKRTSTISWDCGWRSCAPNDFVAAPAGVARLYWISTSRALQRPRPQGVASIQILYPATFSGVDIRPSCNTQCNAPSAFVRCPFKSQPSDPTMADRPTRLRDALLYLLPFPNLCVFAPRPHRYAKRCGQGLCVRFFSDSAPRRRCHQSVFANASIAGPLKLIARITSAAIGTNLAMSAAS